MAVSAIGRGRGALLCAVAAVPALLAACASAPPDSAGNPPASTARTSSPPCDSCQPAQSVRLANGDVLRLWLSIDQQDYRSRPVIELLRSGRPVQSWAAPQGDGWNGALTCVDGATPNCVLVDSAGMHASVAELLLLPDGKLIHPAGAEVSADSPGMRTADLDHDGYLDVIGSTNDYSPNYAQGHNYWQTFRYAGGRFDVTGCARQTAAAPTQLLTGACPAGAQG